MKNNYLCTLGSFWLSVGIFNFREGRMPINKYTNKKKIICIFYCWKNWFVIASLTTLPVEWFNFTGFTTSGGISNWNCALSVQILANITDHHSSLLRRHPQSSHSTKCALMTPNITSTLSLMLLWAWCVNIGCSNLWPRGDSWKMCKSCINSPNLQTGHYYMVITCHLMSPKDFRLYRLLYLVT